VKRFVIVALLPTLAVPAFAAGTHQDVFNVPCSVLWSAVNDAVKNSGKYGIVGTDNTAMTASFTAGGGPGARTVSVVLHAQGNSCEMQTTVGAGPPHNDAGAFKTRVTASLAKLPARQPVRPPNRKRRPIRRRKGARKNRLPEPR
jgi:hypothetical protein